MCRTADQNKFTLYGGARGGGKSYGIRWYGIRYLWLAYHVLGLKHVHGALFCEDYPTLRDRHLSKIPLEFPQWMGTWRESDREFILAPELGSGVLCFRNLDTPSKYQSAEFAIILVDELTKHQVGTFDILRGSLRWPGIEETRFLAGTNPGDIGHLWVKAYWIDHDFPPEMQDIAHKFAFVQALPSENPHLTNDYWEELKSLPEALARAWVYGEWDVFEGQVFAQWRQSKHVVKPFIIPFEWPKWRAVDYGFAAPFCCLWFTSDPATGRTYVYREVYQTGLSDAAQSALIYRCTTDYERINFTLADPSMWTKRFFEGKTFTTADEYMKQGVPLIPADNDRIMGVRTIHRLLADNPADGKPMLQVFSTCSNLIRTLPALPHSKTNPEDVDTRGEDHGFDCLRYGTVRRTPIGIGQQKRYAYKDQFDFLEA